MSVVTHAAGVNHESGQVLLPAGDWRNTERVQLTDDQIKLLAAGVLAREQGYGLGVTR